MGHENAGVVAEDRSLAVEEIGGQLDADWKLCQLLKAATDSHARMVRSTAGDEYEAAAAADSANVLPQPTERHSLVLDVETTTHSVHHGFRLFEDFLLHEVVEAALHDLLKLDLDGLDGTDVAGTIGLAETMDVELAFVDVSDVVVFKIEDLLGVLDDCCWVGGEEEFGRLRDPVVR